MGQYTLGLDPLPKKTRKEVLLDETNQVVPWAALVALIAPFTRGAHQSLGGRPPFPIETMLRIHCLQLWWNLSDSAMEEDLHERPLYRRFAGLDGAARMPDGSTILRFRHLLEKHKLAPQVLAAINTGLAQQGLMLKTGTTVDAVSGLVLTVVGTAANVNDVTQAATLLHGQERDAWGDAGYQGVDKRDEFEGSKVRWEVAVRPGKRRLLDPERALHRLLEKAEKLKACIRAKVEHPFRVIKQQSGYAKVRYCGLVKNTARLTMMFALGNLWMVRRQVMAAQG